MAMCLFGSSTASSGQIRVVERHCIVLLMSLLLMTLHMWFIRSIKQDKFMEFG